MEFQHHNERCSCKDIGAKTLFEESHLLTEMLAEKRKEIYKKYELQNWADLKVQDKTQCSSNSPLSYPERVNDFCFFKNMI